MEHSNESAQPNILIEGSLETGKPPQRQLREKAQKRLTYGKVGFCHLQLPGAWLLVRVQNNHHSSLNNVYFSDPSHGFQKHPRARMAHSAAIFF